MRPYQFNVMYPTTTSAKDAIMYEVSETLILIENI